MSIYNMVLGLYSFDWSCRGICVCIYMYIFFFNTLRYILVLVYDVKFVHSSCLAIVFTVLFYIFISG